MFSRPVRMIAPAVLALGLLLAGCAAPGPSTPGTPSESDPPAPSVECPEAWTGISGPAVTGDAALADVKTLLGSDDVPSGVCVYTSSSGGSVWLIAVPFDPELPSKIIAWLEPLGFSAEERGLWDEGHEKSVAFVPPAGSDVKVAFAMVFNAIPDSLAGNTGLPPGFLKSFGVEPGDELAVFYAWR